MPKGNPYHSQIHSYLALRNSLGWIGILLPFVLVIGMLLFFDGNPVQKTISQYYYTGMRDVLVGALCAIALFLFFYKGYNRYENWSANIAGFFSLGIAWFPTTPAAPLDIIGKVHLICASMFFLILALFSIFFFTRKVPHPTKQKVKRNKIYVICGLVMIACLLAIVIYFNFIQTENSGSHFVFWAETVALITFGISWLTKGGTLYPDKKS
jgi:hypothetical protein